MTKKRDFDIFGIILGIVIGCLIGYFLSSKVGIAVDGNNNEKKQDEYGYIYLLQVGKFDSFNEAETYLASIKSKGLDGIIVKDGNYHYIYGDIGISSDDLDDVETLFQSKGYTPNERKEFILDLGNSVLDDEKKYIFWKEVIVNLIADLNGNEINIDENFYTDIVNLEALTHITMLEKIKDNKVRTKSRLQIYQMLIESLK